MNNPDKVVGGVETNGPVNTQIIIQMFEDGKLSVNEFVEKLKANNQVVYDYIKMLGSVISPTTEVEAWHSVREKSLNKRKSGEYIVKK
jgi:hypothetical protein